MRLGIAATLATLALTAALTSTSAPPAESAAPALVLCVEDTTRVPGSVEAAVAELDDVAELDMSHRRGVGGCPDDAVRVLVTQDDYGTGKPFAWLIPHSDGDRAGVIHLNIDGRELTGHQVTMVVLHELMHVVTRPSDGEWQNSGHTSRCDSVLSEDRACIFAQSGLSDYDRAWITRILT